MADNDNDRKINMKKKKTLDKSIKFEGFDKVLSFLMKRLGIVF